MSNPRVIRVDVFEDENLLKCMLFRCHDGETFQVSVETPNENNWYMAKVGAGEEEDRSDWKYEVANGDTNLGFQEWRQHRDEALASDERHSTNGESRQECDNELPLP